LESAPLKAIWPVAQHQSGRVCEGGAAGLEPDRKGAGSGALKSSMM
jgi:hypothetical protein